ncbi:MULTISPECIES: hypothetical protein [unclassified Streptomyces]|uniref:hypothetical protein n=1 Tax=unclassified Streptomyces TaxID=2593676 RepID=UPI00131C950C|nr:MULTISPECIES: hypothetical protein [unclassified Streptomyces]
MDLAAVFAGLDRIAWPELHHAYGPAEDVPDLLRALTADAEEAAAEAEQELWGSLVHQGTVYEATVAAVPFLARLAVAGVRRANLLGMLGAVAESTDEHGLDRPGAARAAVVGELPLLLPLLSDATPEVRQCAAWAVAQCGQEAGPDTRGALRRRREAETDPLVRADVLTACVRVDPEAAAGLVAIALRATEAPPVRVAALLACVDTGLPWDRELASVVATLAPLDRHLTGSQWRCEPLKDLARSLHERGDVDAAIDVVVAALRRTVEAVRAGADPGTAAAEATWAAESLALRSRAAPSRLLPAMLPLLDVPAVADEVVSAVRDWAEPAPQAVPALVRLSRATDETADRALAALVSLGAPEAGELLASRLADRPHALEAAYRRTLRRPPAPLPCTAVLLDAVRTRLVAVTADASTPRERRSRYGEGLAAVNEPVYLAGLLAGWGPAARAALPELMDALPHHPLPIGQALAAVADVGRDVDAVRALRTHAGAGPRTTRQAAASALHSLTGDATPLLAVLGAALDEGGAVRDGCLRSVAPLGEQARPLLPRLLALLSEPAQTPTVHPTAQAALTAAATVWELTADQQVVLPVVLEGLARATEPWGHRTANQAAEVAVLLGPAARPAVPRLLSMLDRPDTAAAAARALLAAHPGDDRPAGVGLTDLTDRVLSSVAPGGYLHSALGALEALAALGPAAFTPGRLERVRLLADEDRRVIGSGTYVEIILDDEEFRAAARTVLAGLSR